MQGGTPVVLLDIARAAEQSAGTDPNRAAILLQRLATEVRARAQLRVNADLDAYESLLGFAAMTDGLARRLRGGRVKSVSGLERRLRLLLEAVDGAQPGQVVHSG